MDTQRCGICGHVKAINEFNFRNRLIGKHHTTCKDCQRRFKRAFYERNREGYKKKSMQQKVEAIRRNHERVQVYLSAHPCVDCGESDPVVLEFDHLEEKDRPISQLVVDGASWERILKEIKKCQVRCGNCHKKKTAREKGWYKNLGL